MEHLSFDRLLMHQTLVVHELQIYMDDKDRLPRPRELLLIDGLGSRSRQTHQLCIQLKEEFWRRLSGTQM